MKRVLSILLAVLFYNTIATAAVDNSSILRINSYAQSLSSLKRIIHQVTECAQYCSDFSNALEYMESSLIDNNKENLRTIHCKDAVEFNSFYKHFQKILENVIYKRAQLQDITSSQGVAYSDSSSGSILLNESPTFFEKNQVLVYLFLSVVILAAFFLFSHFRVLKAKESVTKELEKKQQELIRDFNIALKSAKILRWRVDGKAGRLVMFDHNMNKVEMTTDELLDLTETEKDRQVSIELLSNLSETEVRTAIVHHKTPWDDTYKPYEASAIAISTLTGDCYGICRDISETYAYQQELKKSDAQKNLIFDNISSILIYLNADFEVQWTNIHTVLEEKVVGLYKHGKKCYESLGLNNPCPCCPVVRTMKTMKVERSETDKFSDGNIYEEVANPIIGESGIEGVVVKLENITERKKLISKLSSTNQLINTMLEALPLPLAIKDAKNNFKYTYVSSIFCDKIVRKKREEIIGTTDYELFDKVIADRFRSDDINIRANYSDGEIINTDEMPMMVDGEERILNIKARFLKLTNGEEYIMAQASDVTDIRRMNNELQLAKTQAEEADKLKSAFLANMSHEIRTPLNAIVGFSELLKHAETLEEKDECMKIIDTNNDLLLRLIGDILDLSKLESGTLKLYPEEFDFSLFFNETYSTLKPRCERSEVELKIENPLFNCHVTLDKNRVLQILTNYINNAVKFTQQGYIKMGYDYVNKGVQFYVEDSGIGISKEKKELLFQRFEKLDNFAQGTGLGLSICKAIAEQMGGRVWAESVEGKGSTFFAWIPCKAIIQVEPSQDKIVNSNPSIKDDTQYASSVSKSILVAEDNNSNYMLLQAILKDHHLTRAINGEEAVKYAKQYKYDVILMDMKMPVMDGLEATRKIREFDKETLIIALTANAFDSDKLNAINAGCNSFMTKPIKRSTLIAAIS